MPSALGVKQRRKLYEKMDIEGFAKRNRARAEARAARREYYKRSKPTPEAPISLSEKIRKKILDNKMKTR